MGLMPTGVAKRRKPSLQKAHDALAAAAHPQQQQQQYHDWDSVSPFTNINSNNLQDEQQHTRLNSSSRDRRSSNIPANDHISIWDEPTGSSQEQQQQQQQQEQQEQQKQHRKRKEDEQFKTLLDNIGSELDGSLEFNQLTSPLDEIDFSSIDYGHFEVTERPIDVAFPQAALAQCSRPSSPASQKHTQPQQQQKKKQQQPQLRLQSPPVFNTLPSSSFSLSSQSYQDLRYGLRQTAGTLGSSTAGIQYWTTQLEELSDTLQELPIPLDGMLRHSSQLLPRTKDALHSLHSADVSSCPTSLILILACLSQIVTLFEQCIPSVLAGPSVAGLSDLSLRLGDYQVDRQAQQALQTHIVGKELSSMLHVTKLIRHTLLSTEWRNISKRTHDLLLEDLQVRTLRLIFQMKQNRGASRMMVS
jgi:hypothetical protein